MDRNKLDSGNTSHGATAPDRTVESKKPDFKEFGDVVTFVIGPQGTGCVSTRFLVHQNFVEHYCPTLKAAFNSTFIEGEMKKYIIDDTTPAAFALFVKWLYTQDITQTSVHDNTTEHWAALVRLWILAEKYLIPQLQNHTVGAINKYRTFSSIIPTSQFQYVYEHTNNDSALRKLLVHFCVWNLKVDEYKKDISTFPPEMILDIATASRLVVRSISGSAPNIVQALHIEG